MDLFAFDVPARRTRQLTFVKQPRRLIGNVVFNEMAISPDGNRAAIIANPPDEPGNAGDLAGAIGPGYHLWILDLRTQRARQISHFVPTPPDPDVPNLPNRNETNFQRVAWSPDGRYVAAWQTIGISLPSGPETAALPPALGDRVWKVWDARSGREVHGRSLLARKDEWVRYAARSPNGRLVASIQPRLDDRHDVKHAIVNIRDARTHRVVRTVVAAGPEPLETAVLWTPDGKYVILLTQGKDTRIRAVDPRTGAVVRDWRQPGQLGRAGFSRNRRWLIVLCGNDLALWDWKTGARRTVKGPSGPGILGADWVELPSRR